SAIASAKVGYGRTGSSCARAHSEAIRVSSSIAAQSNKISCSNRERAKLRLRMASAGGGVTASAADISAAALAISSSSPPFDGAGGNNGGVVAKPFVAERPQKRQPED